MNCVCGWYSFAEISRKYVFCEKCNRIYDTTINKSGIGSFLGFAWVPLKCLVPGCHNHLYGYLAGEYKVGSCKNGHLHVYNNGTFNIEYSSCCHHLPLIHISSGTIINNGFRAKCDECGQIYEVQNKSNPVKCTECNLPLYNDYNNTDFKERLNCRKCGLLYQACEIPFNIVSCKGPGDCTGNYVIDERFRWCSACKRAYDHSGQRSILIRCSLCNTAMLYENKPSIAITAGHYISNAPCSHCGFNSIDLKDASNGVAGIIKDIQQIYSIYHPNQMHIPFSTTLVGTDGVFHKIYRIGGATDQEKTKNHEMNIIKYNEIMSDIDKISANIDKLKVTRELKIILRKRKIHLKMLVDNAYGHSN